jgi:hypothetical protein
MKFRLPIFRVRRQYLLQRMFESKIWHSGSCILRVGERYIARSDAIETCLRAVYLTFTIGLWE